MVLFSFSMTGFHEEYRLQAVILEVLVVVEACLSSWTLTDVIRVFLGDHCIYFVEGSYILYICEFQPVTWRRANSCTSAGILLL